MSDLRLAIPASTSNIGPGFDTLGLALALYNKLEVKPSDRALEIEFETGVGDEFRTGMRRLVRSVVRVFESRTGTEIFGVRFQFSNDVPIARGLGSSATFRMGALQALNMLHGAPLTLADMLDIGCKLEKHTENCVAGLMGGLTASGFINNRVRYAKYPVHPDLTFVAAIPDRPMSTAENRKVLPKRLKFTDAVFNINRVALLIDAMSDAGKFDTLWELFEDKLHQPYRSKLLGPLFDVISAAREAGAHGAFLSGSGSTIMAVASDGKVAEISKAMQSVLGKADWPATVMALKADTEGVRELSV